MFQFRCLIVLAGLAFASSQYHASHYGGSSGGYGGDYKEEHVDYYAPPKYKYEYKVEDPHTGDVKSQEETREGDVVKGFYALKEADGTVREVHYTSDHKNGFNAEVKRIGKAYHPEQVKAHYEQPHKYYR